MFGGFDAEAARARQAFIGAFGAAVGDAVEQVVMAELRAQPSAYRALGVRVPDGAVSLWGLLVLGRQGAYFHIPPSENAFTAMVRRATRRAAPQEQLLRLGQVPGLFLAPPRRTALSFLSPEHGRTICARFTAPSGGTEYFSLILNKKAAPVLERLRAVAR